MAQSTLIFQSTGPKHQEMRNFMMSNLVALSKTKPTFHEPLLPNNKQELLLDPTDANEEWIKKTIVKNLWYRKYSKRRRSNVAVIIVRTVFIGAFLFYCLLLNHSFPTNPNKITNCFKLILFLLQTTSAHCRRF